jgi:serine/threonine protein kinase
LVQQFLFECRKSSFIGVPNRGISICNGTLTLARFILQVVRATLDKNVGYDLAVDIWSLGCTIIEMFTRKPPWSGLEGVSGYGGFLVTSAN